MAEPAIRATGLTKYFGPVIGVEELSFDVAPGEIYGFLGANGAGKTTTIRLLLDLLRPSRGRVTVLGVDCHGQSLEARRRIGYLPGDFPIYPDLTAEGYLRYLGQLDGRPVSPKYLDELLQRFDVSGTDLRRRLRDQSHGMKQKIGIIQALMGHAPVLVLDEPTAGLDPLMVQAFREVLESLRKQGDTTVFLSSHVLSEVETTCDRVGVIRGGHLVATGTIANLKHSAARRVTVEFREPVCAELPAIPGVAIVHRSDRRWVLTMQGPAGPLVRALADLPVHDVEIEPFRLEDYVARHYSEHKMRLVAALIGRSAKQGRLVMLGCFALLTGMQMVLVGQAASIEDNSGFGRLAEMVPAFLQRGVGSKSLLLVSFKGTVALGYFHPVVVVLVSILAVYFVTEVAHEVESGLVDVTLARAVPRARLVIRSLALAWGAVIAAVLLMAAGTRVGLFLLASPAYEPPSPRTMALLLAHLAAVAVCFSGIGLAIASGARRWSTAFTLGALGAVLLYLVHFLAIGWAPMRWVAWISPFNYYPAFSILAGDASSTTNITILLSAAAVFTAIGYRRFLTRDL